MPCRFNGIELNICYCNDSHILYLFKAIAVDQHDCILSM
jgi:hypothetical protein